MAFVAIARALYDYDPQDEGEIALKENDIVYIFEKDQEENAGWWRGKNKEQLTEGLFPSSYVEELPCISKGLALYSYESQNNEELTINEDEPLEIFEKDDEDWWLVKGANGLLGFVPATYVEDNEEIGESNPNNQEDESNEIVEEEEDNSTQKHMKEISEQALESLNAFKDAMTMNPVAPKDITYFPVE
eukprot:jgi/Orpsp1_1/1179850/evm.model.c7180000071063.1